MAIGRLGCWLYLPDLPCPHAKFNYRHIETIIDRSKHVLVSRSQRIRCQPECNKCLPHGNWDTKQEKSDHWPPSIAFSESVNVKSAKCLHEVNEAVYLCSCVCVCVREQPGFVHPQLFIILGRCFIFRDAIIRGLLRETQQKNLDRLQWEKKAIEMHKMAK